MSNELIYKGVNLNTTPNDASLVNYTDNKSIGASTVQEGLDVVADDMANKAIRTNTIPDNDVNNLYGKGFFVNNVNDNYQSNLPTSSTSHDYLLVSMSYGDIAKTGYSTFQICTDYEGYGTNHVWIRWCINNWSSWMQIN